MEKEDLWPESENAFFDPKDFRYTDSIPGFTVLPYNNRYAKSDDGRIFYDCYNGGWMVIEPYKFANGELVVRMQYKWGAAVYTLESILAGKPKHPGGL